MLIEFQLSYISCYIPRSPRITAPSKNYYRKKKLRRLVIPSAKRNPNDSATTTDVPFNFASHYFLSLSAVRPRTKKHNLTPQLFSLFQVSVGRHPPFDRRKVYGWEGQPDGNSFCNKNGNYWWGRIAVAPEAEWMWRSFKAAYRSFGSLFFNSSFKGFLMKREIFYRISNYFQSNQTIQHRLYATLATESSSSFLFSHVSSDWKSISRCLNSHHA